MLSLEELIAKHGEKLSAIELGKDKVYLMLCDRRYVRAGEAELLSKDLHKLGVNALLWMVDEAGVAVFEMSNQEGEDQK